MLHDVVVPKKEQDSPKQTGQVDWYCTGTYVQSGVIF
jgi:hypothetical protein